MDAPDLIAVARMLREQANQSRPSYSTRAIIEACFPGTVVTGRPLPPGIDEVVSRTPSGPVILYRRTLPISKQRFAIAHALAHLLFDGDDDGCQPGRSGDPAREARADHFAAELLAPLDEVAPQVPHLPAAQIEAEGDAYLDAVDEIASRFQVSVGVIYQRIRMLEAQAGLSGGRVT